MRTKRTAIRAALLVGPAALLTACGGAHLDLGLGPTTETGYPAAPDEICAEVTSRFAEAQSQSPRSFEQAEELMAVLADIAGEGEAALAAVDPPPGVEERFSDYLASRAKAVELIEQGSAAARNQQGEAYQRAREAVAKGAEERRRLAVAAGLRGCAAAERG